MSALRDHSLAAACDAIVSKANLRRPQLEAFEKFHQLVRSFGRDIHALTQQDIAHLLADRGYSADTPPELIFELATGVGKTRLMGALLVYLARSRQARNFLILAPRVAILDKLKRECDPSSSKYLFVDRSLLSSPNICFRSDLLSFEPDPTKVNVLVLSPQTITGEDRRFAFSGDFGPALRDYLTGVEDLIVLSDEAHHIGNGGIGAWREAVSRLRPKLYLGFTATPKNAERKTIYSYGLNECLKEGRYTKAVKLWVEPKPGDLTDDDWDHQTIDFGLRRIEAKRAAISELRIARPEFPDVEPVLLVAARDITHADAIGLWLEKYRGLARDEILVAHSGKKGSAASGTERAIGRLVSIDRPGNRVKVVVNVFQLSEGWDVTNVWVIAPLRSLATFTNAIQTMGRGLRLPAGRRIGDDEVDTLDVLCFGKEDFGTIVQAAIKQFGTGAEGSASVAIVDREAHQIRTSKPVTIDVVRPVSVSVPEVVRVPGEPELDFAPQLTRGISSYIEVYDIGSEEFGMEDAAAVRRDFDAVVGSATSQVLDGLRFLDPLRHAGPVRKIVRQVLEDLGGAPGMEISTDAAKLALGVMEAIRTRFRATPSAYVAGQQPHRIEFAAKEMMMPVDLAELPSKDSIDKWK